MKNNHKQNLFDQISQVLHEHHEPYVLGEWERFQQKKIKEKKAETRKMFFKIAASVLMIFTFALAWSHFSSETETTEQLVFDPLPVYPEIFDENPDETIPETEKASGLSDDDSTRDNSPAESPDTERNIPVQSAGNPYYGAELPIERRPFSHVADRLPYGTAMPALFAFFDSRSEEKTETGHSVSRKILTQDDLQIAEASRYQNNSVNHNIITQNDLRLAAEGRHQNDVTFSLAFASVMNIHDANTDLGMGGGFYADLNIGGNFALTSGLFVSRNRLRYENDTAIAQGMAEVVSTDYTTFEVTSDNLMSMRIDHVNLEIPLNLKYSLSSRFSVSAGISSLAFLKEDYDYNFEHEHVILVASQEGTLSSEPVTKTVTLRTSATQTEPSLERVDWAAFLNFSVGYQHSFSGTSSVIFEPFLKMPTGRMASRDITYTSGGVQLKISF